METRHPNSANLKDRPAWKRDALSFLQNVENNELPFLRQHNEWLKSSGDVKIDEALEREKNLIAAIADAKKALARMRETDEQREGINQTQNLIEATKNLTVDRTIKIRGTANGKPTTEEVSFEQLVENIKKNNIGISNIEAESMAGKLFALRSKSDQLMKRCYNVCLQSQGKPERFLPLKNKDRMHQPPHQCRKSPNI